MRTNKLASTPARVAASLALLQVIEAHRSLSDVLPEAKATLSIKDAALVQELCFGVCRFYFDLHPLLQKLLSKPIRKRDQVIEMLLLSALYQLEHSNTPAHAIINETVAACDGLTRSFAKGLVNACLRRLLREPELKQAAKPIHEQMAHPAWICEKLQSAWPKDFTAIMSANNERPPFTLRVDLNTHTREFYLDLLQAENIPSEAHTCVPTAVTLSAARFVGLCPGFDAGWISVQDASSQLAALLLNPKPKMRVLDACAAPGGKSIHLLQQAPDITLWALDIDPARLVRIKENCDRIHKEATLIAHDALAVSDWWDGQLFDAVLLDAPCSASGVIKRHPDIKILRQKEDLAQLTKTQSALLHALAPCVKSGGTLLYSTCSVFPEENAEQIQQFLAAHPEFQDSTASSPLALEKWRQRVPLGMQIFPSDGKMDGFYYALLTKAS